MSLQAFQRAVVDLTLSYSKVLALRQGDATLLASYDLTPLERDRLIAIVNHPGIAVHCSLSRGSRLEVVVGAFPMTCVLLGSRLRAVIDELWQQRQPTNYQLAGEEDAFAACIGGRIAAGELSVEYLPEILAYEMVCLEMTREQRLQGVRDAAIERLVEFRHPATDLLPPLARLTPPPPPGLPAGSYPARVRLCDGRFEVESLTGERERPSCARASGTQRAP